jgi:hypothetical protein
MARRMARLKSIVSFVQLVTFPLKMAKDGCEQIRQSRVVSAEGASRLDFRLNRLLVIQSHVRQASTEPLASALAISSSTPLSSEVPSYMHTSKRGTAPSMSDKRCTPLMIEAAHTSHASCSAALPTDLHT